MLRSYITLLFLLFCLRAVNAQTSSGNVNLIYHWQADSLPQVSGVVYNEVWGYVACTGEEYAVVGSTYGVHFFDLSDLGNIDEVARFEIGTPSIWRDFKSYAGRIYAVADQGASGLTIFDLREAPTAIRQSNQIVDHFQRAHNIFIDERQGRLYVAGSNTRSNGLMVFDLTENPDQPALMASVELQGGGYVHDVYVRDNIAYCSHGFNGYYLWDFTQPAAPRMVASLPASGYNHSSWVTPDGKYAIYAEEIPRGVPLGIVDLSRKETEGIEVLNTFKFPLLAPQHEDNTPHNPYIRDHYAIVSYYEDGVVIFDISDPSHPTRIAYFDTAPDNTDYNGTRNNWGVYPFLPSGHLIATDTENGLFVIKPAINFSDTEADPALDLHIEGDHEPVLCNVDSMILTVEPVPESFYWTRDDVPIAGATPSIVIDHPGRYRVLAEYNHCQRSSNVVEISSGALPDISIVSAGQSPYCPGDTLKLQNNLVADRFEWLRNGEPVANNTPFLVLGQNGDYVLRVSKNGCTLESEQLSVQMLESSRPVIAQQGNLLSATHALNWQWYRDGAPIENANQQTYTVEENGEYFVQAEYENGCRISSNTLNVILTAVEAAPALAAIRGYPNPVSNIFYLTGKAFVEPLQLRLLNATGQLVTELHWDSGELLIDLRPYPSGIYFLQLHNSQGSIIKKILKQ